MLAPVAGWKITIAERPVTMICRNPSGLVIRSGRPAQWTDELMQWPGRPVQGPGKRVRKTVGHHYIF